MGLDDRNKRLIRKQVMTGGSSNIRDLLLTETQEKLVKIIGEKKFTTANETAKQLNISIQNASSKLHTLYRRGYLQRLTTSAESGGIEYVYKSKGYEL